MASTREEIKDPAKLEEAAQLIAQSGFSPGDGVDREVAAEMLMNVAFGDWRAGKTHIGEYNEVCTSESRAFKSLLGWGVDVTTIYRVLALFEVALGKELVKQ
jgi:hypothetical protein